MTEMAPPHSTATEAKPESTTKMGEPLGPIYDALWQELAWLHKKWAEYVALYGTKSSRIDLMNEAAPAFFRIVQDTFWEDVLLHMARLTDSPKSLGKSNLTFRLLAEYVHDGETKAKVECLTSNAIDGTEFCRDWRNRRIAHQDLRLALEKKAELLKPASREKLRKALQALAAVLNAVSHHYLASTTYFEHETSAGGAVSLLYVLQDGVNTAANRRDRLNNGIYDPNDFGPKNV